MGQMKNIAGCQKAFFQEFVPCFQLACITLWLFPSSTPLFEVFQAAHVGISALPQLLQNSPAQSSQLAQVPAEPTPSQGVSEDPAHGAPQLASLERETQHTPPCQGTCLCSYLSINPKTPGNKWHGLCTYLRHEHSVVKFLTVVSIYHTVFANTQLINIKCLVKAFVESSIEVW